MPDSPDSTPLQTTHVHQDSQGVEGEGKRRCSAVKADGTPCRGYALGDAYGDAAGMCTGHARAAGLLQARGEKEGLEQAAGTARPSDSPLDALRDILKSDPRRYAAGIARMLEKGDPRAIGLVERLFTETRQVEKPSTLDALSSLTVEEQRQLLAQLEAARGVEPLASH